MARRAAAGPLKDRLPRVHKKPVHRRVPPWVLAISRRGQVFLNLRVCRKCRPLNIAGGAYLQLSFSPFTHRELATVSLAPGFFLFRNNFQKSSLALFLPFVVAQAYVASLGSSLHSARSSLPVSSRDLFGNQAILRRQGQFSSLHLSIRSSVPVIPRRSSEVESVLPVTAELKFSLLNVIHTAFEFQ